jgi:hypothetical protein
LRASLLETKPVFEVDQRSLSRARIALGKRRFSPRVCFLENTKYFIVMTSNTCNPMKVSKVPAR